MYPEVNSLLLLEIQSRKATTQQPGRPSRGYQGCNVGQLGNIYLDNVKLKAI